VRERIAALGDDTAAIKAYKTECRARVEREQAVILIETQLGACR
jgi:hypothetical protein